MAFRGRGGNRGRGRGRGTGTGSYGPSRPARSGIRTRGGGYKKFDSQRTREVERGSEEPDEQSANEASIESDDDLGDIDQESDAEDVQAYATLLKSFKSEAAGSDSRPRKRRRVDHDVAMTARQPTDDQQDASEADFASASEVDRESLSGASEEDDLASVHASDIESDTSEETHTDLNPYEMHFTAGKGVGAVAKPYASSHSDHKGASRGSLIAGLTAPFTATTIKSLGVATSVEELPIKPRLKKTDKRLEEDGVRCAPYVLSYTDLLVTNRTPRSAAPLRKLLSLHAVNHVLIGRDRVLKNNARLAQAGEDEMLELRDQGFTRPKVLILTETRQMCAKYVESIVDWFQPEQQENKQRFQDSFVDLIDQNDMPEDHQELFGGNNDNNFLTTIKFTRKTIKFFSAFYQSDIIFASPLGLRRVIEHEDKKKRDHDFLSSIEVVVVDQADAMQMQNWENTELVFQHLNLQPKELRDCDVNRVRNWYLDGQAKQFRQTIVLGAYLTPEVNRLFNTELQNTTGKVKVTQTYPGAIQSATGMGVKQTFSRFPSRSPLEDPNARFKFFTSSVLPALLRIPQPAEGGQGILIFIPSYFDFLRIRNFFATSTMTENVSFGAIHDYSEVSEQRRARSHFLSGKHTILLYTQRAHHFFRLRLRGVKRVVMYGVPDNPIFYEEVAAGYLSSSIETGVGAGECLVRSVFSKFDALKMERIVGTDRVKGMLAGTGDTFEFV